MTTGESADGPATAVVRRFWQRLFHEGALEEAADLVTPDLAWRGSLGATASDLAGFLAYARAAAEGMPDLRVELAEVLERDGRVAARLVFRATHAGPLLGVPATGERVEYVGAGFFDVVDGRVARAWVVGDTLALRRQLGP